MLSYFQRWHNVELSLKPSFAPVWGRCSGAPRICADVPDLETQDARDGTCAHWVAATILRAFRDPCLVVPVAADLVGKCDSKGTVITQEMYDAARVFVEDVLAHCNEYGGLETIHVEESLVATRIHPSVKGPSDCWWFGNDRLIIWDFKFGHRYVDPTWAYQFVVYLAAILDLLKIDGLHEQRIYVEFRVVIPRCHTADNPVQSFAFTAADARAYFNILHHQAVKALTSSAECVPGAHCTLCSGVHVCPAARKIDMLAADYVERALPDTLTADGLSFELALLEWLQQIIKPRQEALKAMATARMQAGEFIPGFVLEPAQGQRKFRQDATTVINTVNMLYGVDLSEPAKACTPAEAERRFKAKGLPVAAIAPMVDRPQLPPKLVSADSSKVKLVFRTGER